MGEMLAAQGRSLTGPVTQVKTWAISCLLRAPTAEGGGFYPTLLGGGAVTPAGRARRWRPT